MGLHLNYELRLPGSTSPERVHARLSALRKYASHLPVTCVSEVIAVGPGPKHWAEAPDKHAGLVGLWAELNADPYSDEEPPIRGDLTTAVGFAIWPGRESEAATIGFIRRLDAARGVDDWFWYCHCKTQYASLVSEQHLVTVHTALISVLDHAIELGIEVDVQDETGYWETRDAVVLIDSVRKMNALIACFAGALSDAIEPVSVEAPIFEHPDFEHLEMDARRSRP